MRKLGASLVGNSGHSVAEQIAMIKEAGFDCFFFTYKDDTDIDLIKRTADEVGIEIETAHMPFDGANHLWEEGEAGEEFLPFARKTILDAEDAVQRLHDLQHVKVGTLRVGVTYSLSTVLTEGLICFMKEFPDVKLKVFYKTVDELLTLLRERKVDLVLSYKPLCEAADIESMPLFENALALVVSKEHPLAKRARIKLKELEGLPLILPSEGLQARMMLDRLLEGNDVSLASKLELNETNILLQMVATGNYVTILSTSALFGKARFKAIPIDEPRNIMEASLLSLKGAYQKASAKEFVKILLDTEAVKRRLMDMFE